MRKSHRVGVVVILAVAALFASASWAGEFHFVASELGAGEAIWEPNVVLIDQSTDLKGGLTFILHNPTKTEHAFAVHGLYELVMEKGTMMVDPGVEVEKMNYSLKPINITVAPGEKKQFYVNTTELRGEHAVGKHFRYFCPIHKDVHVGGSIYVVR